MKSKMLFTLMMIALALVVTIGATMAVFTGDAESDENDVVAGTLSVEEVASQSFTLSGIKPGDEWTGYVRLVNDGTLPISYIMGNVEIVSDITPNSPLAGGFADVIEVTSLAFTDQITVNDGGDQLFKYIAAFDDNGDGRLSLAEFATGWNDTPIRGDANYYFVSMNDFGNTDSILLNSGAAWRMTLELKFMTNPGSDWETVEFAEMNEYQGASLDFKINLKAVQQGAPMASSLDVNSPAFWE